jgi:hypothetical protein
MPPARGRILYAVVGVLWAAVVAFGLSRLWKYEATAGAAALPPTAWPTGTHVSRTPGLPTLVLLTHPKCPCSRATLDELAALMTDCRGKLAATVLMLRPDGMPDGWERSDLWDSAAAIPGVSVASDVGGAESRRFGAATSGQSLLYAADGRLLFAGGITGSRGHRGDNDGRATVTALVLGTTAAASGPAATPVFGCPLSNDPSACPKEGTPPCHSR